MLNDVDVQINIGADADFGFVLDIFSPFNLPDQAVSTDTFGTAPVPTPPVGGESHGPAPVDTGLVPSPDTELDSTISGDFQFSPDFQTPFFSAEWAIG